MLPGRLPSNSKEQYVPVDYYRNRLLYDPDSDPLIDKSRFAAFSVGCLFLIRELHIIAELVHHLHEGLIALLLHPGEGASRRFRNGTRK